VYAVVSVGPAVEGSPYTPERKYPIVFGSTSKVRSPVIASLGCLFMRSRFDREPYTGELASRGELSDKVSDNNSTYTVGVTAVPKVDSFTIAR
jgi:hypothetical protein